MKSRITALIMSIFFIMGCTSSGTIDLSDSLSAGRGFIESSLRGDYTIAEKYMLKDSINNQYLDGWRDFSKNLTPLERENYREADIIIDSTRSVNDSTDIIFYRNSYKKEPTKLKLIKRGNEWKVDFKYTFND